MRRAPHKRHHFSMSPLGMFTQKVITHKALGVLEVHDEISIPGPPGNWILTRRRAVAINPADWQEVEEAPDPGAILGCDYACVVKAVGKDVMRYKIGDRVVVFVRGGKIVWFQT